MSANDKTIGSVAVISLKLYSTLARLVFMVVGLNRLSRMVFHCGCLFLNEMRPAYIA